MVFSDTTNSQGIVQDTYFEASANSNSYRIEDLTRNANNALDNVVTLILGEDSRWQFDSTNATDLPIGVADLVSGQKDYSFDADFLLIKSIEIKDSTGNWKRLVPIDNLSLEERQALSGFETTNGEPLYYDKMGESILLYPSPNYNSTGGLKAYFQRNIEYFVAGDTTKKPGFAEHLHKYISLYCAYVYACAKELPKQATLAKRLEYFEGNKLRGGNDKGAISAFYGYRELDFRKKLTPKIENTR
jgi:hypothetical protein